VVNLCKNNLNVFHAADVHTRVLISL